MSEKKDQNKSWLDKLGDALLREPQDRAQLINLLRDSKERKLLNHETLNMIESLLTFSQLRVRDVMIARAQMVTLEEHQTIADVLPIITHSSHSRFPVINQDHDAIKGILLAKDLLRFVFEQKNLQKPLEPLLRKAKIVPESKHLDALLKEFRLTRNHMAIVVDEYGGIAGLVTIEDVLEEIVGDIIDETDNPQFGNIIKLDQQSFNVKALTSIEEFNSYFKTELSDADFDTIGGW